MLYLEGTEGCTEKGVHGRVCSAAPEGGAGNQETHGFQAGEALVSAEQREPGELSVAHCPAGPSFKLSGPPGTRQSPVRQTEISWSQEKTIETQNTGSSPCSATYVL